MINRGGKPDIDLWLRRDDETEGNYLDFEAYRAMGLRRSLEKTSVKIGKSTAYLARLSAQYEWRRRVLAWDRWESGEINRITAAGQAEMRERLARQARNIQARSAKRILDMTEQDIAALSPMQAAALLRISADIEMRARNIDLDQAEGAPFQIVVNTIVDQSPNEEELMDAAFGEAEKIPESGIVEAENILLNVIA